MCTHMDAEKRNATQQLQRRVPTIRCGCWGRKLRQKKDSVACNAVIILKGIGFVCAPPPSLVWSEGLGAHCGSKQGTPIKL